MNYNNTGIECSYIQNLLRNSYTPTIRILNSKQDAYLHEVFIYDGGIWRRDERLLNNNTTEPIFTRYADYTLGKRSLGVTKNHIAVSNEYTSDLHEALGDYLRMYRDYTHVDLMSLYNCFSNRYEGDFNIPVLITEDSNINTINAYQTTVIDPKLRLTVIPIRFNKVYKIYCKQPTSANIQILLYDEKDLITYTAPDGSPAEFTTNSFTYNYTRYIKNHNYQATLNYSNPFTVSSDAIVEDSAFYQSFERYLYLFIQVPEEFVEYLVVLEEQPQALQPQFTNVLSTGVNSNISLLKNIEEISKPYSNKLLGYLLEYFISPINALPQNINRIQKALQTYPYTVFPSNSTTDLEYSFDTGCATLISNKSKDPDIIVPEKVFEGSKWFTVNSIDRRSFLNCTSLTSITIPDSVTSIGDDAFSNCPIEIAIIPATACSYIKNSALKSVTITSGTSIGNFAFSGCASLTSVTIGSGVTSIGDDAFYDCTSLTSVTIGNGVTSIGGSVFSGCPIKTASIPAMACRHIKNDALRTVVITSGDSIGSQALSDCSGLTSVTIPYSVTSIGNSAFKGCTSLTSVTIGSGVTSIGDFAFSGCTSLTSITIPDSVTSISNSAFYQCTGLTSITIGNGVTSIGSRAFAGCSSLESIMIPDSVTSIGSYAFRSCTSLTSIMIPDSVTSISNSAFYGCSGLTSIMIPDSVTSIGGSAFRSCTSLTSISYQGTMTQWNKITLGTNWDNGTGDYIIHCTDGDIAKS